MVLTADEVVHNFPTPHTDFLTQYVDYPVPAAKASDLLAFDGSVILDRTAGQVGARCDHEAYNTLTLNLAGEIIEGRRTVAEPGTCTARQRRPTRWGATRQRRRPALHAAHRDGRPRRGDHHVEHGPPGGRKG